GMDAAFDSYAKAHPDDADRQAKWRLARSQLVDRFLRTNGSGRTSSFANTAVVKITPTLIGMLRAQLLAHCPDVSQPCNWVRRELPQKVTDAVKGPMFAGAM